MPGYRMKIKLAHPVVSEILEEACIFIHESKILSYSSRCGQGRKRKADVKTLRTLTELYKISRFTITKEQNHEKNSRDDKKK